MKEEVLLEHKFGKPRPFKVPEGYFKNFETNVLKRIPVQEVHKTHSIKRYLRPVTWAACIVCAVVIGITYMNKINNEKSSHIANVTSSHDFQTSGVTDDFIVDEISDYVMLDNDDLYSFIAEN